MYVCIYIYTYNTCYLKGGGWGPLEIFFNICRGLDLTTENISNSINVSKYFNIGRPGGRGGGAVNYFYKLISILKLVKINIV